MRGSGSKSGKPWAKLTAFAGPWRARFSRVISRMTDSVTLCALSEVPVLVSGIGTLQAQVGARAGVAACRLLEAALPPTADVARPAGLGEEVKDIGPAEQADHLAAADHRHATDALADEETGCLIDPGFLGDRDDARAHDVARGLALLGEDVRLGHDADDVALVGDDRSAGDVLRGQDLRDLVDRRLLTKRDHVSRHDLFDRYHCSGV